MRELTSTLRKLEFTSEKKLRSYSARITLTSNFGLGVTWAMARGAKAGKVSAQMLGVQDEVAKSRWVDLLTSCCMSRATRDHDRIFCAGCMADVAVFFSQDVTPVRLPQHSLVTLMADHLDPIMGNLLAGELAANLDTLISLSSEAWGAIPESFTCLELEEIVEAGVLAHG